MPEGDFALVDAPGAQMVSHTHYVPEADAYFVAFERDRNDVDKFYFKDIKANLDIAAQWLDSSGRPQGEIIDIFSGEGQPAFCALCPQRKKRCVPIGLAKRFPGRVRFRGRSYHERGRQYHGRGV